MVKAFEGAVFVDTIKIITHVKSAEVLQIDNSLLFLIIAWTSKKTVSKDIISSDKEDSQTD